MTPACSLETRPLHLDQLKTGIFDILIIGGGINGAGMSRDLALRSHAKNAGLKIGLVERGHFASGTSGKNSQLIHGGLRYLKNLEFRLVREALRERSILLSIAPHLIEPLPFLIPNYSFFARCLYGVGLTVYDLLAGARNIGPHRKLSREQVLHIEPSLNDRNLHSGFIFYDCLVHSARLVLENIWDAIRKGAVAVNYVSAETFERQPNGLWNVGLRDVLSNQCWTTRARDLVDATGAWSTEGSLRLVRGSHILVPRLTESPNAIAYFEPSGRVIFFIPWSLARAGAVDLTLVGTTDVDHSGGPDDVHISPDEVRYLRQMIAQVFPAKAAVEPVAAYSSLRPLLRDESQSPSATSREHRIWRSSNDILHIAGGKYTTYRSMCEEAAGIVLERVAPSLAKLHLTASVPLLNPEHDTPDGLAQDPPVGQGLLTPRQSRQIAYAVHHEMAQHLSDVMFVSTYWGYERRWNRESLRPLAQSVGRHLGWDQARMEDEIERTLIQMALPEF